MGASCTERLGFVRILGGAQVPWFYLTYRPSPDSPWGYLGVISFGAGFGAQEIFEQVRALGLPESDAIEVARSLDGGPDWVPNASSESLLECATTLPIPWDPGTVAGSWAVCYSTNFGAQYAKLLPSGIFYEMAVFERSTALDPWHLAVYDQFDWSVFYDGQDVDPDCRAFISLTTGQREAIQEDRGNSYVRNRTLTPEEALPVVNGYGNSSRDLLGECT